MASDIPTASCGCTSDTAVACSKPTCPFSTCLACALEGQAATFIGEGPLISPALVVLGPVEKLGNDPFLHCSGIPDASNPSARCGKWLCEAHSLDDSNDWFACEICSDSFCSDCGILACDVCCRELLCSTCAKGRLISCGECQRDFCSEHFGGVACDGCQSMFCKDCCCLADWCGVCTATMCWHCQQGDSAVCDFCQGSMCGACSAVLMLECSGSCKQAFCTRPVCRAALVGACEACQTQFCELCTCALCGAVPCGCYTIDTLAACSKCQTLSCEGCREEGSCCRQRSAKRRKTVCSMSMEVCTTSLGK